MSPSEVLAIKSYEKATGENVLITIDTTKSVANEDLGDPVLELNGKAHYLVPGIDPVTLAAILDIVLSFIFGIIDKMREGNLCVKPVSTGVDGEVVGLPMSVADRAKAVQETAKAPKWRQRARLHRDMRNELNGAVNAWDMTNGMLATVAADENYDLVEGSIEEGEEPDFGWL